MTCVDRLAAALVVALVSTALAPAAAADTLYTQTNDSEANEVLAFERARDGSVALARRVRTGGEGTGAGLESQGAVLLHGRWLLAVNAGSDDVSVLRVGRGRPRLVHTARSGGDRPVSVTAHGSLVYVANAGGRGSIVGFRLRRDGRLARIGGSRRPLSGLADPGPAQIEFSPDGRVLVVTERHTDRIDTYLVGRGGRATRPLTRRSAGPTPFGFAFDRRGRLIVSEAFNGAGDGSAVSSYALRGRRLRAISASVPTTESSACWVAVTPGGRFAYSTNTPSGSISGFRISRGGRLRLLDADGRTAVVGPGTAPTDLVVRRDARYLDTLNAREGSIASFRIGRDGGLTEVGRARGLPEGVVGLTGG